MRVFRAGSIEGSQISRHVVLSSLLWKLLERGGTQGIQFLLTIVLAWYLSPEQYGVIALITIFIALATVFIQGGLNTALIQKADVDAVDFSSVFYLSVFVASCLYTVLYFMAPVIAHFYSTPVLIPVTRVLSLTLFPGAVNSIQVAKVSRSMQFKRYFLSSISGIVGSGVLGVILAYKGYGVWALVAQQLANSVLVTVILWYTVKWRPCLRFSWARMRYLYSFGWKLLVSGLLDTLFKNIYGLVIGKVFSRDMLGYFNRGQQFPTVIAANLDGSIQSVMMPVLSANQSNLPFVRSMARRSIKTSSYILFPLMLGLAVVAKPMVSVVLTDKWLPCVPFLQLSCLAYALYPIHTANLTAINALGRSDIFLKLEIIKKTLVILMLALTIRFGIYAMAVGQVITGILATFINAYPNKRLLNYSYWEQLSDLLPSFLLALIMASCVFFVCHFVAGSALKLATGVISGAFVFVLLSTYFKLDSYIFLIQTIRGVMNER
jgi:O-antigen/teichoic acid export membrane protein